MLLREAKEILKENGYSMKKKSFDQVVKKLDLQQEITDDEVLESQLAMEDALHTIWDAVGEFEIIGDKDFDEDNDVCIVKFAFINNPKFIFQLIVEGNGDYYTIEKRLRIDDRTGRTVTCIDSEDITDIIDFMTEEAF